MQSIPNYAVVLTEDAPTGTIAGAIAHHDEGAAVAGDKEAAKLKRDTVLSMMGWDEDAVRIMRVEMTPITDPDQ